MESFIKFMIDIIIIWSLYKLTFYIVTVGNYQKVRLKGVGSGGEGEQLGFGIYGGSYETFDYFKIKFLAFIGFN